ncbi:MAG: hemolysin family protein [Steroidobacteraceae bacterium]|jgi:putative hemolysin|nr:hemolysin family protein [Steroidobacteraceae bacterium]
MLVHVLILLLLIAINGLFAMAELAVVSSRRTRLEQLAEEGSRGARAALRLVDDPTRFLSSVQIGITLIGVLAGVYSGVTFAEPLGGWLAQWTLIAPWAETGAYVMVVIGVTYLSVVLGELVPKRWAMTHPEGTATLLAPVLEGVAWASAPLVWLLQRSTEVLLGLLRLNRTERAAITEDEIRAMIAEGTRTGVFHQQEHRMIEGVLRLADRTVRSVMVPRGDVVWLDLDDSREALGRLVQASGHSRYLVCRGELDELVGVARATDVIDWLHADAGVELSQRVAAPLVVQETTTVLRLLELFREAALQIAIVVDEHGSIEGVVTPADVLKAIAGELPESGGLEAPEAVRRDDQSWLLDGRLPIDEAERLLERDDMASGDDYTTVAGFVLAQLGRLPATAESFVWKDLRFEVVDMDGRRIDKLLVQHVAPAKSSEPATN